MLLSMTDMHKIPLEKDPAGVILFPQPFTPFTADPTMELLQGARI
jgi:hypothetical protein